MKDRRKKTRRGKKALSDEVITRCINRMLEHLINDIEWEKSQKEKTDE